MNEFRDALTTIDENALILDRLVRELHAARRAGKPPTESLVERIEHAVIRIDERIPESVKKTRLRDPAGTGRPPGFEGVDLYGLRLELSGADEAYDAALPDLAAASEAYETALATVSWWDAAREYEAREREADRRAEQEQARRPL